MLKAINGYTKNSKCFFGRYLLLLLLWLIGLPMFAQIHTVYLHLEPTLENDLILKQHLQQIKKDSVANQQIQSNYSKIQYESSYNGEVLNLLPVGVPMFTIENVSPKWGNNPKTAKASQVSMPAGSLVWIIKPILQVDSLVYDSTFKLFGIRYMVYFPSNQKLGIISGFALPEYCISSRGYGNLYTGKPQQGSAMSYHSSFDYTDQVLNFWNRDEGRPKPTDEQKLQGWVKPHDWIFQCYRRFVKDSHAMQIFVEVGKVSVTAAGKVSSISSSKTPPIALYQWNLEKEVGVQSVPYLNSPIGMVVHQAKGLNGLRNVIEIQHWSESCGSEGGSTYFSFEEPEKEEGKNDIGMSNSAQEGLNLLGHFSAVVDGGVYYYAEQLIFPTDTLVTGELKGNYYEKITGIPNYLIYRIVKWEDIGDEEGLFDESNANMEGDIKPESESNGGAAAEQAAIANQIDAMHSTMTEEKAYFRWRNNPKQLLELKKSIDHRPNNSYD